MPPCFFVRLSLGGGGAASYFLFFADDKTYHAVIHSLLIVGEAVKHIPDHVRHEMPEIEWRKIAGMRNWLAHVYFSANIDILRDVIQTKIPGLLQSTSAFSEREGG